MDNKQQIINLFSQVSSIVGKYDKIFELTGEKFNIFDILGLTSLEVQTHSTFIAELLNPKGSHCQKDLFLKLFLARLNITDFDSDKAIVKVEKSTGSISEDYQDGGNIDIIVTDKMNRAIIIENKIYAGDQKNQLKRYYSYGNKFHNHFTLLYLTLDGRDATPESKVDLTEKEFSCISYQNEILDWLSTCREKAIELPIIRETITQYINLIKTLTNHTMNNSMNDEIVNKIVTNDEYVKTLFEIHRVDLMNNVKKELLYKFKNQLLELEDEFNLKSDFDPDFGLVNDASYLKFKIKHSQKELYVRFGFCVYTNNMFYQLHSDLDILPEDKESILKRMGHRPAGFGEIWFNWFETNLRWWNDSSEPWLAIIDGSLKENFKDKIKKILEKLNGFDL